MKRLNTILVPTDLSDNSRRALNYGCWLAAEEKAAIIILHVADELNAWELYCDDLNFVCASQKLWPLDRVLTEASLDLSRFLEPHLRGFKNIPSARKRVVMGPIAQRIVSVAEEEKADLIVMSPSRRRGLHNYFNGGVTNRITRLSPCPVLSVTAPLPSPTWRGKFMPLIFGWPRPRPVEI
jgi:nucleotide-binding universal stress UspA family protein